MPDLANEQRRTAASILIKAILEWGGKGSDLANYFGVSPTTISNWRNVGPVSQRKPAVLSEEHIIQLLGILNFRIQQNIFYLKQMMHLGGLDSKTSTMFAMTAGEVFEGMSEYCKKINEANGPGLDERFEEFRIIQEKGGPGALRSLFDIKASWGVQEIPVAEDIIDEPLDLDAIKESHRVSQDEKGKIEEATKAYPEFFLASLREKILKPKKKGKKK